MKPTSYQWCWSKSILGLDNCQLQVIGSNWFLNEDSTGSSTSSFRGMIDLGKPCLGVGQLFFDPPVLAFPPPSVTHLPLSLLPPTHSVYQPFLSQLVSVWCHPLPFNAYHYRQGLYCSSIYSLGNSLWWVVASVFITSMGEWVVF